MKDRSTAGPGKATLVYVGAVGDTKVEALVADHANRHAAYLKRRDLASRLRRAGLPSPLPMEGAIAKVLAEAALFRNGSTLVGSIAYQTYGGLLGVKLDEANFRTQDIDIAQPAGLRVDANAPHLDLLAALRDVDPTFEPMFHAQEPTLVAGYRNNDNFSIEFLSPLRKTRGPSTLAQFVGLPGVGAQQLKYLEFVLKEPVGSLLLHHSGIAVSVPAPMRYAVHKLLVAVLRQTGGPGGSNAAKSLKDLRQAESLIEASHYARSEQTLGEAWLDAWGRGPKWRKVLRDGTLRLAASPLSILSDSVQQAAAGNGSDCPFFHASDPRLALKGIGRDIPLGSG